MSFLYLSRTIRMPVRAVGLAILDFHGGEIATAPDTFKAAAIADLINMAEPLAVAREDEHEAKEAALSRSLFKIRSDR